MQEVILPELIAELDDALILVISSVDEYLAPLFERVYRGEEIEYGFQWNLIKMEDINYVVGLVVSWGPGEESVTIGFTQELWDFLSIIRERGQLILMTDWRILEEGISFEDEPREFLVTKALVINDAYSGMETLSQQVVDEALVSEPKEELYNLLDVLRPANTSSFLN